MPRKPKRLTPAELAEIQALAGLGLTQEQVARVKGMCPDTLRKYAQDDWQLGKAKALARVSRTAYELAVSGKCPAMTMFYLKSQARWREYPLEDLSQILGGPAIHED
jgi:hypothetical protein